MENMLNNLYIKLTTYIKDKYFNKALQKVIDNNRSTVNWDKVEKPYCLSLDKHTLAIINNNSEVQTIEIYKRELFNFIWVANLALDFSNKDRRYPINSVTINDKGDHIALMHNRWYTSEVLLFHFFNNKWKHKKTFKSYEVRDKNCSISLVDIRYVEFCKHLDTKKDILAIHIKAGVAIIHGYYRPKTSGMIAVGHV